MKTLVFSDTHLSLPFEEKKFNFLKGIIRNADQVIINGDFWEGYFISFKHFMDSPWKHLFPLLKKKQAVYIFGNHDRKRFSDTDIHLFSAKSTDSYKLVSGDKTFIFEHGNRLLPLENSEENNIVSGKPTLMTTFMEHVERLIVKTTGSTYQIGLRKLNNIIKELAKPELKEGEYYVCGHTHCAEIDHKNRFINSGMVKHGLGQYLLIENGAVYAKQELYH